MNDFYRKKGFLTHPLYFIIVIFIYTGILSAQSAKIEREDHTPAGMDKDYYQYYFETQPNLRTSEKAKLEFNLIRVLKLEMVRRNKNIAKEIVTGVKPESITYAQITPDSIWVRGIKDIFRFIKYTNYMYVVKYTDYQLFVSYEMDPKLYMLDPFQSELLFKKDNVFLSTPIAP